LLCLLLLRLWLLLALWLLLLLLLLRLLLWLLLLLLLLLLLVWLCCYCCCCCCCGSCCSCSCSCTWRCCCCCCVVVVVVLVVVVVAVVVVVVGCGCCCRCCCCCRCRCRRCRCRCFCFCGTPTSSPHIRYTLPCNPGREPLDYDFCAHGMDGVQGIKGLLVHLALWPHSAEDVSAVSMGDIAPPTTMKELVSLRVGSFRFASFRLVSSRAMAVTISRSFASVSFRFASCPPLPFRFRVLRDVARAREQADGTLMRHTARVDHHRPFTQAPHAIAHARSRMRAFTHARARRCTCTRSCPGSGAGTSAGTHVRMLQPRRGPVLPKNVQRFVPHERQSGRHGPGGPRHVAAEVLQPRGNAARGRSLVHELVREHRLFHAEQGARHTHA
jgi:hypothetical protein